MSPEFQTWLRAAFSVGQKLGMIEDELHRAGVSRHETDFFGQYHFEHREEIVKELKSLLNEEVFP